MYASTADVQLVIQHISNAEQYFYTRSNHDFKHFTALMSDTSSDNSNVILACDVHAVLRKLDSALTGYGEEQGKKIGYKRPYRRFARDFKDQVFLYNENILNLLVVLLMDEPDETRQNLQQMVGRMSVSEWRARKIDDKLKEKFAPSYQVVVGSLEEMVDLVRQLVVELVSGEECSLAEFEAKEVIVAFHSY